MNTTNTVTLTMNLPYEDREKFLPFCVWYDEEPIMLVTEKEDEPK